MSEVLKFKIQVLQPSNQELLLDYENKRLEHSDIEPAKRSFIAWSAPWRQESLEHYLPLGWSFGAWSHSDEFLGYFLAQPLLFFRGLTQTLWVEHLQADTEAAARVLSEVAYRTSREKHFQTMLVNNPQHWLKCLDKWSPQHLEGGVVEVKTSKMS